MPRPTDALRPFREPVRRWFRDSFEAPTRAQIEGWEAIRSGESTLLLAPTGSGKTLAAFLVAIDREMFRLEAAGAPRCRVLYVSPLKALAVDVERNLRAPLAGIQAAAERAGAEARRLEVGIRSGDTPPQERARLRRSPPDILITTPESLFLMLTSAAAAGLATVDTVIIDEIHSVAGTKRGAHLALSLERLERLRESDEGPLQRVGLSATQRPLDEIARLLAGGQPEGADGWRSRPVRVVDAGARKPIELSIEVPVEDMSRLGSSEAPRTAERSGESEDLFADFADLDAHGARDGQGASSEVDEIPSGSAAFESGARSIWPAVWPRLVEQIRAHRSTMVFVNSRRLAERLAAALNDEAGEEIALAHHGSISRERRLVIEDRLKTGSLPAIVATSSMELGIDMGAVDLVVQVEAPPSVASGLQRIGRANHSVGETPRGVVVPKFRGDLLACSAAARAMLDGAVESTRYPRNPLDVLAQQIVAIVAIEPFDVEDLWGLVRRAAPFAELPRASFDGVLDMLSGRYPSDEFRELRPRIVWDRVRGTVRARQGAQRVAVSNAGTIPDRGLYGVFLAGGDERSSRRVGELDEEMVFETRIGDVFLLGASSWRVEDISHDRVVVTPAPGEAGKMPFWHGDRPGRPREFGLAIGRLCRQLSTEDEDSALRRLTDHHCLDPSAATNLLAYLRDQEEASGHLPTDRKVVVERFQDEVGDWRVCVLTPFGASVHAPWAMAVSARLEEGRRTSVESVWSDDGIVFRLPELDEPPDVAAFVPTADEVRELVVRRLPSTALFAARFRENASRALLLPRRRPGRRNPLWVQRKRAANLLAVAASFPSFPIVLETYRECLQDVFDLSGLEETLREIARRSIRLVTVDSTAPSPFAAALLFSYVSNFIYEGDAPLAERRAQSLAIDHRQLRELLGESELRQLLDPDVIAEVERSLQRLGERQRARHVDGVHDLLLALGDLSRDELAARCEPDSPVGEWLTALEAERRIVPIRVVGDERWIAAEDAAVFRDALGVSLPRGLPAAFLEPPEDAVRSVVLRYARTHGPFTADEISARTGLGAPRVAAVLERIEAEGRIIGGAYRREGRGHEWCARDVLRTIKSRSLARLREEVEPVPPAALARLLVEWQGLTRPASGLDGVLDAVDRLQGCPLLASEIESSILPARVHGYDPAYLDSLLASGELVWRGVEPVGARDARIALYLRDELPLFPSRAQAPEDELAQQVLDTLRAGGALFFSSIVRAIGGFQGDVLDALWRLVWAGLVTNDTLAPLRALVGSARESAGRRRRRERLRRTTRSGPAGSEGRWSLLPAGDDRTPADEEPLDKEPSDTGPSETERRAALARVLLERYGVLTREAVAAEGIEGGFSAVYEVLKAMEEAGRVRRGYFVEGLGAAQFALAGADERLRRAREGEDEPKTLVLAATDPASPWGSILPWPSAVGERLERRGGARVIVRDGELVGYLGRQEDALVTFLPEEAARRPAAARDLARALAELVETGRLRALVLTRVDGAPVERSELIGALEAAGFEASGAGWQKRGSSHRVRRWEV